LFWIHSKGRLGINRLRASGFGLQASGFRLQASGIMN